jgi:hypothetical protein
LGRLPNAADRDRHRPISAVTAPQSNGIDQPDVATTPRISFVERNRAYERLPSKVGNIAVFRKQQNDTRDWQHFVSFDGSARRRSVFRRVLERLEWLFRQGCFPS